MKYSYAHIHSYNRTVVCHDPLQMLFGNCWKVIRGFEDISYWGSCCSELFSDKYVLLPYMMRLAFRDVISDSLVQLETSFFFFEANWLWRGPDRRVY